MQRRKVNNPLALAVLALLAEHPRHPYDMGRILRERHKEESIKLNYGSLYMVVGQLVKFGFVRAEETVRDAARPERTVYALTDTGHVELYDWLKELIATPHKEFYDFEAGLALIGVLSPEQAVSFLEQRLVALKTHNSTARQTMKMALDGGLDPAHLIELEYRLTLHEAEQHYVERLIERILNDQAFGRDWRDLYSNEKGKEQK